MDETYINVKGQWKYLYRAVDSGGQTLDFLLTAKRDASAALRFFRKAIRQPGEPEVVTIMQEGTGTHAQMVMRYQEKVLSIVLDVKSAGFRHRDHRFRQSDHGFRSQDHGFRRMTRFGRNKSESAVELNRKVRSVYIGISGRFGSEYA